jgi:2-polyprenyl-3-methyl-5-hydroxy-6-metoxy-1,4-benzoquinol methylase
MKCENILDSFFETITKKDIFQKKKMDSYIHSMTLDEKEKLARRLKFFLINGETVDSLAEAYLAFCNYFAEERMHFVRTGAYRYHSSEETLPLYNNSQYMHNYMIGLGLSVYMWKIQRDNMRFFLKECRECACNGGRYLEVGPGHGEYFVSAMENTNFDSYIGVDISETAAMITRNFLGYAAEEKKKFDILHKDFFDFKAEECFQGIVLGEILEHVENPLAFLKKVYELADENAFIFLSTAINSPYPDHIYHFHNAEDIYMLFDQANLRVKKEMYTTAEGISLEKAAKKNFDIVAGFILEKVK